MLSALSKYLSCYDKRILQTLAMPIWAYQSLYPINVQEELEEELSPDEEPPIDEEEDTIRICTPEGEGNVTIEELQELIDGGVDFSIPAQNEVCVIIAPIP